MPESTTLTEILNVTGEGILLDILVEVDFINAGSGIRANNKGWLKITVDGSVIYNKYTLTTYNSGDSEYMGFLTFYETTVQNGYTKPFDIRSVNAKVGKLVRNEDITDGSGEIILLPSHVYFKNSMKIEANFLTDYSNVSEYPAKNIIQTHYILI